MRTQLRILAGLLMLWLALVILMTLTPPASEIHSISTSPRAGMDVPQMDPDPATFTHTGLWAREHGPDGSVAYLRDIRRH